MGCGCSYQTKQLIESGGLADTLIGASARPEAQARCVRGSMISLKRYLESESANSSIHSEPVEKDMLTMILAAYRSALQEMGSCSVEACAASGSELKRGLDDLSEGLTPGMKAEAVRSTEAQVRAELQDWGRLTAKHYQEKTGEVKELLLLLARTAESVGERDKRCAGQITDVTTRLKGIVSLEDLAEIRASIERSAADLKTSVERMTAESKEVINQLRAEVSTYQARLEEAEEVASRDVLTGVRSRLYAESQIQRRILASTPFCVAIIDINGFKKVNDEHGHLVGDELLKQFAAELLSNCRPLDVIARWGGDEFIVVLDCNQQEANVQMDRLRKWVFGNYTLQGVSANKKLHVDASIGLAKHLPGETMKAVLDRADAQMYKDKAALRRSGAVGSR
jgi:diguanylate cyclase (GGDEF)-like protein